MDGVIETYISRWKAVAEIERQEQLASSLELRWQQLNAVIGIAIGLGIYDPKEDDTEVIGRWVKLKEVATHQNPAR